jgi:hypothetical protein
MHAGFALDWETASDADSRVCLERIFDIPMRHFAEKLHSGLD